MKFNKGDTVKDKDWPEFGVGLITVKRKARIRVLFDNGSKGYEEKNFKYLEIVKTKAEREKNIKEAYERFCGREPKTSEA